ncbi:hypothetical protein [uncultured Akkermansia sp.]|uniref:hypothetical protein n=1 Tax=uncultured Akkermansia sp. TaxID=512294 RepID=UPI0025D5ED6B|nr:hypothetical protein [uncultured Akkermansia sp.]
MRRSRTGENAVGKEAPGEIPGKMSQGKIKGAKGSRATAGVTNPACGAPWTLVKYQQDGSCYRKRLQEKGITCVMMVGNIFYFPCVTGDFRVNIFSGRQEWTPCFP